MDVSAMSRPSLLFHHNANICLARHYFQLQRHPPALVPTPAPCGRHAVVRHRCGACQTRPRTVVSKWHTGRTIFGVSATLGSTLGTQPDFDRQLGSPVSPTLGTGVEGASPVARPVTVTPFAPTRAGQKSNQREQNEPLWVRDHY